MQLDMGKFEQFAEKFSGIDFMKLIIEHGALIYDILIGFIFLIIVIGFAKRGLIRTIAPVSCVILALGTGIAAANSFTEQVTDRVYAGMVEKVASQLQQAMQASGLSYSMQEVIKGALPDSVTEAAGIATRTAVAQTVHFVILGVVAVLSFILYWVLSKLLEGAADLPIIRVLDFLGGLVLGVAFCILFFYLIVRVSKHYGFDLFEQLSDGTIMLKWFTGVK